MDNQRQGGFYHESMKPSWFYMQIVPKVFDLPVIWCLFLLYRKLMRAAGSKYIFLEGHYILSRRNANPLFEFYHLADYKYTIITSIVLTITYKRNIIWNHHTEYILKIICIFIFINHSHIKKISSYSNMAMIEYINGVKGV